MEEPAGGGEPLDGGHVQVEEEALHHARGQGQEVGSSARAGLAARGAGLASSQHLSTFGPHPYNTLTDSEKGQFHETRYRVFLDA